MRRSLLDVALRTATAMVDLLAPISQRCAYAGRACARTGTALEINASPQRLDLPSDHIRAARDAGVKFAIDSDAHSVSDLGNMPYGVGTAQLVQERSDLFIHAWQVRGWPPLQASISAQTN